MSNEAWGWAAIAIIVPGLFALGGSIMSSATPHFSFVKICFSVAAVILLTRIVLWLVLIDENIGFRIVASLFMFTLTGIVTVESLRWVQEAETKALKLVDEKMKKEQNPPPLPIGQAGPSVPSPVVRSPTDRLQPEEGIVTSTADPSKRFGGKAKLESSGIPKSYAIGKPSSETLEDKRKNQAFIDKMTELSSKAQTIEQECWRGDMGCIARFKSWNEELSTYMHSHGEGHDFVQSDNQSRWTMTLRQFPNLHPEIQRVAIWLQAKQWFIGKWIDEHKAKLNSL